MSLKPEQNTLLTRIEGDAPMGRYLRETAWFPAVISSVLEAGGDPYPVRLLGENFVAFRGEDGRVGFFSEYCPHRGVSLLLARNEDNALRCIFHGWKFRSDGVTVEAPTQTTEHDAFCKKVPLEHYPTREAAGVVWVWLGEAEPPPLPDFEFMSMGGENLHVTRTIVDFNWIQANEGLVDSAHVAVLHQDWLNRMVNNPKLANAAHDTAPVYEFENRPDGFRYAAIREVPEEQRYIRVTEFTQPFYSFIPSDQGACFICVPIDDMRTAFWAVRYDPDKPINDSPWKPAPDPMNWPPKLPGDKSNRWGQDRQSMRDGSSFSGFNEHFLHEDLAVAVSQGPIADRRKEFLNGGDQGVVMMRSLLLRRARDFEAGKVKPHTPPDPAIRIAAGSMLVGKADDWRTQRLA